jgi:hypothetical protein
MRRTCTSQSPASGPRKNAFCFPQRTGCSVLQADATDSIWVPILVTTGADETEARATTLMKIPAGTNAPEESAQIAKP